MASGRTSGANTTPLGRSPSLNTPKPNSLGSSLLNPSYMSSQTMLKRDRDEDDYQSTNWPPDMQDSSKKKKKRSRWGGDEKEKVFIPGLPTVLPNNLNPQQERAYLLQLQIEEISRRLRTGDLGIPPNPEERSPSPEPIYNSEGKRLNTREYRTRKKLEDDRHSLIQEMYSVNPDYKPPADYKPPLVKVSEKVMIPQEEHPEINFVGLLIGPRGNTLKSMEKETGAKIIIRGKGSVKEGKVGRKDGQPLPGEDEPLHAFVTGNSNESVKKAVNKIKEIIRQGVEVPEGQNDLRRMQLRELALLNGTLRENDGPRCTNCGATTHKSWSCPDKPNVTNNLICTNCGSAGHIAKDCREQKNQTGTLGVADKSKIDEEYMSLMAELGEGPPPPAKSVSIGTTQSTANPLAPPPGPPRAVMAPPVPTQTVQVSVTSTPVAVTTQSVWSGTIQNKVTPVRTTTVPALTTSGIQGGIQTGVQAPVLIPPPLVPPLNPASLAQPAMMPPWQTTFPVPTTLQPAAVLGTQGVVTPVPSILAAPPPPPPPAATQAQPVLPGAAAWLAAAAAAAAAAATPTVSQAATVPAAPWQITPQQTVVAPVPPPPGVAAVPPPAGSMFPWPGFIGVPRPPSLQASLQTLAAAPPPPPPSSTVQAASTTSSAPSVQNVNISSLATIPNLLTAPPPPPPS